MKKTDNKFLKRFQTFRWWTILIAMGWTLARCSKNDPSKKEERGASNPIEKAAEQDTLDSNSIATDAHPLLSIQGYDITIKDTVPYRSDIKTPITYKLLSKEVAVVPAQTQSTKPPKRTVDDFGDPITLDLAKNLIADFDIEFGKTVGKALNEKVFNNPKKNLTAQDKIDIINSVRTELSKDIIYSVSFNRQSILSLLAQPHVVGFKAYYCLGLPEKEGRERKPSIILVGVDKNNNDLESGRTIPNSTSHRSIMLEESKQEAMSKGAALRQKALIYEVGGTDNIKTRDEKLNK